MLRGWQLWRLSGYALLVARLAFGQSPTSAGIGGRILDESRRGVTGVDVAVTDQATGLSMRGVSQTDGRYLVSGLDVGGPYSVTARRVGSPVTRRTGVFLTLGQQLQLDIVLGQQAAILPAVEVRAAQDRGFSRSHMGAETFLSDSLIHQAPVINRDLYDLVRLVPQMSTWFPATASGSGPRVNSIRIDGVLDQVPSSNLAGGALYGGRVIPLDAVKEYQVLLDPFDVRQGSFAGAAINVVTRGGTNEFHGSVFGYGTNERLGADAPFVRSVRYDKTQFGFSAGGPVVHDRMFFFVSSEAQKREIPAPGPFLDATGTGGGALPVRVADVTRFQQLLAARGLDGGSAGAVTNPNPSTSIFVRVDAPLPRWNSRVTVRTTLTHADSSIFSRPTMLAPTDCSTSACFPLSSLQHSRWLDKQSTAAQFISNLPSGAYNEMLLGFTDIVSGFHPGVMQPLILVSVPGSNGVPGTLQSGTHEIATGQRNASWTAELTDNLSLSVGAHRLTVGGSIQPFDLRAFQLRGSYGVWEFASLDSLQAGLVSRYRVTRDTGSVTAASGSYDALYAGDDWRVTSRLSATLGIRADVPLLRAHPSYVAAVDSAFHLRTDGVPSGTVQWSPRVGFNYSLIESGNHRTQVRGGIGLFTGRPPMFWLFGGFSAYGMAGRTLQCGSLAGDGGPPPAFRPAFDDPPLACAGGQTFGSVPGAEIDIIDPRFRLPQTLRASLATDLQLPFGATGTFEGLYTHATRAVFFSSINLSDPVTSDRRGRLMYGTIGASGAASPRRVSPQLGDVIEVTNESRDRSSDVTGTVRKLSRVVDVAASISYGRSLDAQSPRIVSALLADPWRFGRPVAGRENDLALGTSDFDQPFRLRASGTLHSPWRALGTDIVFVYVGGSGLPFTYVAGGTQGRGDLNSDGAVGNDPVYIPRSAFDTAEIRFDGPQADVKAQQSAFEQFIDGAACLREQRGRIMSRNSCRSPWMSVTNVTIRQTLPAVPVHGLVFEAQVFNLLNLLNPRWGRAEVPTGASITTTSQVALLSQVGETGGTLPQPIYRFDREMARYTHDNLDSYYQMQFALRYDF